MFNVVILSGRICNELELRYTNSQIPVLSFKVAVDRKYKAGEEKQTDFIDCVAWRSQAEFISKYFQKGSAIGLEGSIQARKYDDKEGVTHRVFEVIVSNVHFIERKKKDESAYTADSPENFTVIDEGDDIPF